MDQFQGHAHADLLAQLQRMIGGRRFVRSRYTNREGEVSTITVQYGVSVENLYRKDIAMLHNVIIPELEAAGDQASADAARIILASREKSLTEGIGQRDDYTNRETYTVVCPGIKVHNVTGDIYLTGLVVSKTVEVPGTYKAVNHRPLTILKAAVERRLPSAKYRQYKLPNVARIAGNGETLEFYT